MASIMAFPGARGIRRENYATLYTKMPVWTLKLGKDLVRHQCPEYICTYLRLRLSACQDLMNNARDSGGSVSSSSGAGVFGVYTRASISRSPCDFQHALCEITPPPAPLSLPGQWGHLGSSSGNVYEAPPDLSLEGPVNSNAYLV